MAVVSFFRDPRCKLSHPRLKFLLPPSSSVHWAFMGMPDDAANHSIENPSDSEPLTGRLGYLGWFPVILLTRPINNSTNIFLMLATCLH